MLKTWEPWVSKCTAICRSPSNMFPDLIPRSLWWTRWSLWLPVLLFPRHDGDQIFVRWSCIRHRKLHARTVSRQETWARQKKTTSNLVSSHFGRQLALDDTTMTQEWQDATCTRSSYPIRWRSSMGMVVLLKIRQTIWYAEAFPRRTSNSWMPWMRKSWVRRLIGTAMSEKPMHM